ncbi:2OG-Fe(II) oxygenase [Fluviispira sanaruensis]|uniref:Prolyl 4-hydroxylase alpha subunit Fe(2+) 2OG dioxygenase domain-containing protein n=1 Tax=Fluviispira sanaruensis TaxID=2493639 RepID=A0A4P2VT02_FLUSA|nr:2OG-Fe(II) oxygenase [Fluviispira sanaruensis]BBH52445.1 hypothetical protein JCM31447_08860 [Fluviispira sanaruensis]
MVEIIQNEHNKNQLSSLIYSNFKQESKPFNHLYIENFFNREYALSLYQKASCIPSSNYKLHKTGYNYALFADKEFYNFVYSDDFLRFIYNSFNLNISRSKYYKYPQVYKFDPSFRGLPIHNDFNQNRDFTVIFYLSPDWNPSFGGELFLYDKKYISILNNDRNSVGQVRNKSASEEAEVKKVSPYFNLFFAFQISQFSWHSVSAVLNGWTRYALIVDFDKR